MKKVFKSNTYFLIILILSIIIPAFFLRPLFNLLDITDVRIRLFLSHFTVFFIPAVIYTIVTKSDIKGLFRLNKLHFKDILIIILLSFACQPIMNACSAISNLFFENNVSTLLFDIADTPILILLMLMALMPSITEEITLRGIVLSGYNDKSITKAALVNGLLFGIFHLDGHQFLYAAVVGFLLAYVVRITNSIFASMIMHFIINGTSVVMQQLIIKVYRLLNMEEVLQQTQTVSFNEKLIVVKVWCVIGIVFIPAVFGLIGVLKKRNIKRNISAYKEQLEIEKNDDERIINIPLILTIILYLAYMTYVTFFY